MRDKRRTVKGELSPSEFDEFNLRKGDRTIRELLMESVGIEVDPRPRGRPIEDAVRRQHQAYRDSVEAEIRDRMNKYVGDFEALTEGVQVTCPRCGTSWVTRLQGPRQIPCHVCGHQVLIPAPPQPTEPLTESNVPSEGESDADMARVRYKMDHGYKFDKKEG